VRALKEGRCALFVVDLEGWLMVLELLWPGVLGKGALVLIWWRRHFVGDLKIPLRTSIKLP
jgi:hypothetical protein